MRILLIGDSIIDNAAYVKSGEPDVAKQVQTLLPRFEVQRRAVDGSVTSEVLSEQVGDILPGDLIVLSSGGNDALMNVKVLDNTQELTSRSLLNTFWNIREKFQNDYSKLLAALRARQNKVLVFTIYNPAFAAHGSEIEDQRAAEAGLSLYNDVIQREALKNKCNILEIRSLFDDPKDYANPIEPSALGGEKLAKAIKLWVSAQTG